jgi:hypothetical protein
MDVSTVMIVIVGTMPALSANKIVKIVHPAGRLFQRMVEITANRFAKI